MLNRIEKCVYVHYMCTVSRANNTFHIWYLKSERASESEWVRKYEKRNWETSRSFISLTVTVSFVSKFIRNYFMSSPKHFTARFYFIFVVFVFFFLFLLSHFYYCCFDSLFCLFCMALPFIQLRSHSLFCFCFMFFSHCMCVYVYVCILYMFCMDEWMLF